MPPPIVILRARAEARAALFGAGVFPTIEEAVQPLLEFADERDLIRATVETVIIEAFTPYIAQD